jgi:hypothetical protein
MRTEKPGCKVRALTFLYFFARGPLAEALEELPIQRLYRVRPHRCWAQEPAMRWIASLGDVSKLSVKQFRHTPRGTPADTVRLLRVLHHWTNLCNQQPQGILMAGSVA